MSDTEGGGLCSGVVDRQRDYEGVSDSEREREREGKREGVLPPIIYFYAYTCGIHLFFVNYCIYLLLFIALHVLRPKQYVFVFFKSSDPHLFLYYY